MFFILHIKFSLILKISFPHEYVELPSAKLQISDFSTKKKISLMNMLNNNGSNIKPCGVPRQTSDYLLYEELTLILRFLKLG